MGCAASASCLTRASAVEPDDADLAVDAPPPPSDGSCFFRVESDRGARKPIKDESSEEGKLSEAVTPHTGSPKECDVETHWAPQGTHMSSGDVKGWIDDLMAGDAGSALSESHSSADHLQPVLAHHSRHSQHRPAQSRKPDWREQPQAHAQDQEEDTVQPFSVEDADLSRVESLEELEKEKKLELERESAKRPLLRSGILSIVDSPIPLSMQLGKALSAPEDIKDIQLKGCTVGDEDLQTIMKAVKKRGVRGLTLARCEATDSQAAELARFLHEREKSLRPLEQLGLDGNVKLTDKAATALSVALRSNNTLTELSLWGTSVSDHGATALARALKTNTTLQQLWLGECEGVTDEGAAALKESLQVNTTLQQLGLVCTGVSDELQDEIEDLVQSQRERGSAKRRTAAK
mmetsp:Transcript_3586/g.8458  ORF Transcript_3586/g.8458 Transcript_3586/m.8458 type:complete len:406 (-) Transcript_3586:170-1387(-)